MNKLPLPKKLKLIVALDDLQKANNDDIDSAATLLQTEAAKALPKVLVECVEKKDMAEFKYFIDTILDNTMRGYEEKELAEEMRKRNWKRPSTEPAASEKEEEGERMFVFFPGFKCSCQK